MALTERNAELDKGELVTKINSYTKLTYGNCDEGRFESDKREACGRGVHTTRIAACTSEHEKVLINGQHSKQCADQSAENCEHDKQRLWSAKKCIMSQW